MKRDDCKKAIHHLASEWLCRPENFGADWPSFSSFRDWCEGAGNGQYFKFRSVMGPANDAEQWFDEEVKVLRRQRAAHTPRA